MRNTQKHRGLFHGLALVWMAVAGSLIFAQGTEELLERARRLVAEKRLDAALAVLDQIVTAAPEDALALATRADALRLAGQNEAARRDYASVVRLQPRAADAWFWLATIDRWAGNDRAAEPSYGRVLEIQKCYVDALKGRARSRLRLGNGAGADADLRAALVCQPDDPEAVDLLAGFLAGRGDARQARGLIDRARSGPESAPLQRLLGDTERERGRDAAALAAYRRAAELDPADVPSAYWIGVLESRDGTAAAALAAWDELLKRKPGDPAALAGKARILMREGQRDAARALLAQALAASPGDQDARLLRGELAASFNQPAAARADYRAVGASALDNLEAWSALDRVGPPRSFGFDATYDDSRVLEGLEEAGLPAPSGTIVASRIQYLTEGAGGRLLVPLTEFTDAAADVVLRREAVKNLDRDLTIYDFDVRSAAAGLNHILSRSWSVAWRAGATRYSPRTTSAVDRDAAFLGSLRALWRSDRQRLALDAGSDSFLWRGFAGDTTFRILTRRRAGADWERNLGHDWFAGLTGSVTGYEGGNTVGAGWAALGWSRGPRSVTFRFRHDPFPARFLSVPGNNLEFISYDALSVEGETPLGAGFHLSGEALAGIYGATPEILATSRVEGASKRNRQGRARAALGWSPHRFRPLTLGVDVFADQYAFDTGDYNNIDTVSWTPFAQLAGNVGPRWRYEARYGRGFVDDERDSSYGTRSFSGAMDVRLGRLSRLDGAPRLGVDARFGSNGLNEDHSRARLFLRFPF